MSGASGPRGGGSRSKAEISATQPVFGAGSVDLQGKDPAAFLAGEVLANLVAFLERQEWFPQIPLGKAAGQQERAPERTGPQVLRAQAKVYDAELIIETMPGLLSVVIEVNDARFHVLVGLCLAEQLESAERALGPGGVINGEPALIGAVSLQSQREPLSVLAYEATADPSLMSHLLGALSGIDPAPQRVLMASAGLAGLTLVFDEHVEMRLFRQLSSGPHPEVELTLALDGAGFNHLPAPLAVWRRGGCDLGLVREHLHAASDGWALASTSLRDLYAAGLPAGYAGGDFAPEASRIGEMTARMHIALAEAFGVVSPTPAPERSPRGSSGSLLSAAEIRIHGSYSLRAIVRSEVGWFVRDFVSEAGPVPSADWARHSPLWDLVTMVGSFNDAARATALERQPLEPDALADLALSWVRRNQQALTDAYLQTAGIEKLVMDPQAFVLELDHLLYPKIHR